VIDPTLNYTTCLSGTDGDDQGYAITEDGSGNSFVTGETLATDFLTSSSYQTNQTDNDVFVTKLNSGGTGVGFSTYMGDSGADIGRGIAVDLWGSACVMGTTYSTDFLTTNQYKSTYHCGDTSDRGHGVAVLSSAIYVAGFTESVSDQDGGDFPAKPTYNDNPSAYQPSQQGGAGFDAFVAKMTP
jgi:hypothetical protein